MLDVIPLMAHVKVYAKYAMPKPKIAMHASFGVMTKCLMTWLAA